MVVTKVWRSMWGGAQDRPHRTPVHGEVDRPSDRGWEGDEDDLAALPDDAQDAVAVLLPQIRHVGSAGFEDPQAEQPEHRYQREVVAVRRVPRGGE